MIFKDFCKSTLILTSLSYISVLSNSYAMDVSEKKEQKEPNRPSIFKEFTHIGPYVHRFPYTNQEARTQENRTETINKNFTEWRRRLRALDPSFTDDSSLDETLRRLELILQLKKLDPNAQIESNTKVHTISNAIERLELKQKLQALVPNAKIDSQLSISDLKAHIESLETITNYLNRFPNAQIDPQTAVPLELIHAMDDLTTYQRIEALEKAKELEQKLSSGPTTASLSSSPTTTQTP